MIKRVSLLVMLPVFLMWSAIAHAEQFKRTSVIAAKTVQYYDAQGNEVSEAKFKEIVEKGRGSHTGAKERARRVHTIPRTVEVRTEKHFLWSLETTKNTIYFLGSMHVLTRDSYPLAEEMESAYATCQKIVFETDLEGLNDPGQQVKMVMLGLYPLGQTLQHNISEETYTALKERVAGSGFSMAQFDRFKPWLCALTLAAMELQRLGMDPSLGVDSYFFNKAKKDEKERIFLESVEYQLGLFAKMDQQEQESFLRQTIEELEVMETMASDMVWSWKTGDVDKLGSIFNRSFQDNPDMHERLVIERNKKWISQIEKLMNQDDNVLVIVGAGHMVGSHSLLELLRQKGHNITQS